MGVAQTGGEVLRISATSASFVVPVKASTSSLNPIDVPATLQAVMKWIRFIGMWALSGILAGLPIFAQQQVLNGVAAVVNDKVITRDDVEQYSIRALQAAAKQTRTQEAFEQKQIEIFRDSLELLIERQLILHEFETAGYNLPETIIDDYVNQQVREEFGDRISSVKTLHQRNQTFESYRKDIRDTFIITTMSRKNVTQSFIISPKRIEKFYNENLTRYQVGDRAKVRVIVIEKARHARGEPMKIATEVSRRARAGEDFAHLADETSDDARRNKGGDRGWVENNESDLRKELRDFVFQGKAGEISDPIDAEGAIFVVKIENRELAHQRPLSEVQQEVEQTLKIVETERLRKKWIAKLKAKSMIKYF